MVLCKGACLVGTNVAVPGRKVSHTLDDALRMDIENYLAGDILVKTDRASMACGLELRSPFLDRELATFCISVPSRLKISPRGDKLILRDAYSNVWPRAVRVRGKQGFGAPVSEWLQRKSFRELKEAFLGDKKKRIYDVLRYEQSQHLMAGDDMRTWILLVLSLWMEKNAFEVA